MPKTVNIADKSKMESAMKAMNTRFLRGISSLYMSNVRNLAIEIGLEIDDTTGSEYNKVLPIKGTKEQISEFERRVQYIRVNVKLKSD